MTERQEALQKRSASEGPVRCFNLDFRTARQLEDKGLGHTCSNPGSSYRGPTISLSNPCGTYYVAANWVFSQESKSFVRN